MTTDAEIVDLLRRLVTAVERLSPPEAHGDGLSQGDSAILATLLPAISAAIGDVVFTVEDLRNEAEADDDLLAALGELSGRQLGRLFARGSGHEIAGCRVERAGEARDGVLWSVRR